MILMDTHDFLLLSDISSPTFQALKRHTSGLRPAQPGKGARSDLWSLGQAVAIRVARELRKRGIDRESCQEVLQYLWQLGDKAVQAHFNANRTHILIVNDKAMPELMPLNALVKAVFNKEALRPHGMEPSALNTMTIWNEMNLARAKLQIERKKHRAVRTGQN
jgi:hypothetical protein